jgi:molecular chaperone DnaK
MYADMQAQQAAGGAEGAPGGEQAKPQDDVVDADFKEVKDSK